MLGKLLKYDFRALNRVMLPLQGCVLLAGIACSFLVNFTYRGITNSFSRNYYLSDSSPVLPLEEMLNATIAMLSGLFFAVVFASFWVTLFLIARHFYKSFLRDEGYLAFTLPVTTGQSLLSKVIAGSVWLLINGVIICFTVVLLSLIGFTDEGLINGSAIEVYGDFFAEFANTPGVVAIAEVIVLALLLLLCNVLKVYAALVMGATAARTHKVLAGVGIYMICSIVMQMVLTFFTIGSTVFFEASNFAQYSNYEWFYVIQSFVIPLFIFYVVFIVVYFVLSRHLLKTKLNLD